MSDIPGIDQLRKLLSTIERGASLAKISLGADWQDLKKLVANPGSPGSLSGAADTWQLEVKAAINRSQGQLLERVKSIGTAWKGPAEERFAAFVGLLDQCYTTLVTICDQITEALRNTRNALLTFWGAVLAVAITAAAVIAACIAAAIPSLGGSLAGVFGALATFIGAVAVATVALFNFLNTLRDTVSKLSDQVSAQKGFPESGRWPRPAMSVANDHHGDWQVKTA